MKLPRPVPGGVVNSRLLFWFTLARRLSHRTVQPHHPSLSVDDIPRLSRSLHQIHADSHHRVLKTGASGRDVPSSTYRLFARLVIDNDHLHLVLLSLDRLSAFIEDNVQRPLPLPFNKQPLWLTPRAVDDSRLAPKALLRSHMDSVLDDDIMQVRSSVICNISVSSTLDNRLDLSSAVSDDIHNYLNIYFNNVWSLVLIYDFKSQFSTQLLAASAQMNDLPHFALSLDILSRLRRCDENSTVWSSRQVSEDEFARQIPQLPLSPINVDFHTVVEAIELFVSNYPSSNANAEQDGTANISIHIPNRPPEWMCIYLCLRCGAVEAAMHLLERTNIQVEKFFTCFLLGSEHLSK